MNFFIWRINVSFSKYLDFCVIMKSRNFSVCDFIIDIATEWKLDFWLFLLDPKNSLLEKCPDTEFFLVRIFLHSDWIRRDTDYLSVSSPNEGNEGPEKTPYLDTFHALIDIKFSVRYYVVLFCRILFSSSYWDYHCPTVRFFSCLCYWCYGRLSNCSPMS